jgi:hypothetical protein
MVRCAAIGTSNSIMKDCFTWHLFNNPANNSGMSVTSAGLLGASPSAIGPYFISSDAFFQNCDYCLIDLCVIDLTVVNGKSADLLSIMQWVEWIGHMARRNGCQPVFVLIPVIEYATHPHPVFDLYRSIIRRHQFHYLDVRDLIRNLTAGEISAIEPLYLDGAHLGDAISQTMAGILKRFFLSDSRAEYREVDITFAFRNFHTLSLAKLAAPGVKRVSHKTGLLSFEGIELSAQAPIEINVGRIDRVHAVMVNAARCYRKVVFEGDESVVKNFSLRPYFPVSLEGRLTPIVAPLRDRSGRITLTIARDDAVTDEPTMHEMPITDDTPASVEFSDLLVEAGTQVVTYQARVPRHDRTDLVALDAQSSMA